MTDDSEGPSARAIGRRLKLTREALGLRPSEFCERAQIARPTYSDIEQGKKMPGIDKARALRKAYGITLDWIYEGDISSVPYKLADAIKALKEARKAQGNPHPILIRGARKQSAKLPHS